MGFWWYFCIKRVAENSYQDMVNVVLHKQEYFDVKRSDLLSVTMGEPFFIFEEELGQDEIYYFPLIKNQEIVMVMGICGANNGWNVSLSTEYVDILNDIGYTKSSYFFSRKGDVLLAENPRKSFRIFDMNKEVQIVSTPNLFIWQDKQGEYGQFRLFHRQVMDLLLLYMDMEPIMFIYGILE